MMRAERDIFPPLALARCRWPQVAPPADDVGSVTMDGEDDSWSRALVAGVGHLYSGLIVSAVQRMALSDDVPPSVAGTSAGGREGVTLLPPPFWPLLLCRPGAEDGENLGLKDV